LSKEAAAIVNAWRVPVPTYDPRLSVRKRVAYGFGLPVMVTVAVPFGGNVKGPDNWTPIVKALAPTLVTVQESTKASPPDKGDAVGLRIERVADGLTVPVPPVSSE